MTQIEELLIQLIKIPSLSGQEKNIGNFIIKKLQGNGFTTKKQFVARDRFNIIATKGKSKKWLVAHIDTVVGSSPFKITKNKIFGRGSCDNKQSVAASIIVGNIMKNINLLFTVGEEDNFIGAKEAKKAKTLKNAELVIVQEPTNFKIITGQRGVITFIVESKGKQQHSSLGNHDSAIHKLITLLNDLQKENWTAFNVGLITGGVAENIVSDYAQAIVVVRPKNTLEHNKIIQKLKKIKNADIVLKNNIIPSASSLGFPENIAKGFSETAFFKNSIQFGGGNIKFAHTDHEYIQRKDLNTLPKKLIKLLE